jgi:hypothetical protein
MKTALSETQVRELVADWYRKLDEHAPLDDLLPMVSPRDLTMTFPEATLRSRSEFQRWYETVTHRFFDETHTLKQVTVRLRGDTADLDVVVNWRARMWDAPEATSRPLDFDSVQAWTVKRENGSAVITVYDVKSLVPLAGSASL